MRIVIVGAGKVGEVLCKDLSLEGYDVFLIEQNKERLEEIIDMADLTGFVGSGTSVEVQLEAGVDNADIFIAVSEKDEINIIASIIAKKLGAKHTVARVRSPEFSQNVEFAQNELGISFMINPERESARTIMDTIKFPGAISVDSFMKGKVNILEFSVKEGSPLENQALKDISYSKGHILICAVDRAGQAFIPDGNFVLEKNDRIQVTGEISSLKEFIIKFDYPDTLIKSVLIVGGGEMGYYLAEGLAKRKLKVKIIEIDEKRADYLAEALPNVLVVHGDGTDHDTLFEQRFQNYDAIVSCTPIDEENIMLAMFAESMADGKNIVKISRDRLTPLAKKLGLHTIITPKSIIADTITRYVRSKTKISGSKVENLHRLLNREIEAIQFSIGEKNQALGIPFKDLKVKPGVLFACIQRDNKIIFPTGNDYFEAGDNVVVISKLKFLNEFEDLLVK
ncbi:MAG: Trk system potassium transporter TrkA [Bacillota bacterium]|nr:Trk system potassium transporter TrkA [Bacillota bacterium]